MLYLKLIHLLILFIHLIDEQFCDLVDSENTLHQYKCKGSYRYNEYYINNSVDKDMDVSKTAKRYCKRNIYNFTDKVTNSSSNYSVDDIDSGMGVTRDCAIGDNGGYDVYNSCGGCCGGGCCGGGCCGAGGDVYRCIEGAYRAVPFSPSSELHNTTGRYTRLPNGQPLAAGGYNRDLGHVESFVCEGSEYEWRRLPDSPIPVSTRGFNAIPDRVGEGVWCVGGSRVTSRGPASTNTVWRIAGAGRLTHRGMHSDCNGRRAYEDELAIDDADHDDVDEVDEEEEEEEEEEAELVWHYGPNLHRRRQNLRLQYISGILVVSRGHCDGQSLDHEYEWLDEATESNKHVENGSDKHYRWRIGHCEHIQLRNIGIADNTNSIFDVTFICLGKRGRLEKQSESDGMVRRSNKKDVIKSVNCVQLERKNNLLGKLIYDTDFVQRLSYFPITSYEIYNLLL